MSGSVYCRGRGKTESKDGTRSVKAARDPSQARRRSNGDCLCGARRKRFVLYLDLSCAITFPPIPSRECSFAVGITTNSLAATGDREGRTATVYRTGVVIFQLNRPPHLFNYDCIAIWI